ncbi:NAD(P)H-binding protein [Bowmanella dokdonensis]
MTALVLGATGLVGRELVRQLLADGRYTRVTCLLRRPLNEFSHPKLTVVQADFGLLQEYEGYFKADHLYICLGTTMKKAGSREAFRRVDFDYVHIAAQLARAQKVKSLVWISSVGADAGSSSFYLRTKGELENAIFRIPGLGPAAAVRPSLLLGKRSEARPLEQLGMLLGRLLGPLMRGPLAKYRPVPAAQVASQMIGLQRFD